MAEVDYTVPIAPETDGILADLDPVDRYDVGGRSLGSDPEAIALTADKARLACHFEALGIPTPPTRIDRSVPEGFPPLWAARSWSSPVDGAGSLDTFVVLDPTARRLASKP